MSIPRNGLRAPTVACCLLFLAIPFAALAQSQLDSVIVIGTREPQRLSKSSADVVVIDANVIRNTTADSVEDLLRREAGLQVTRNGGPAQSSGYFIRGASPSGTVVLLDGVRVGSATLGQVEFESLALAQIDRIEVFRGPASSLYGADAVGGVVQIFTRRGEGAPHITGGVAAGGYGSAKADLGVSGAHGDFDYAIAAGSERSRGVSALRPNDQFGSYNPDNDGYSSHFGQVRLGYAPAVGHRVDVVLMQTRLNAQYDSADFNPPDLNADPTPDFRNRLRTTLASVDYRGDVNSWWTATLQVAKNVDDARSGGTVVRQFKTNREQATWQNALHLAVDQQVVLVYEHLREEVDGEVFADKPRRSNNAFVAGYTGSFGAGGLEASLRHDDNSAYGGNTTANVGLSYRLAEGLKLRALAGTTFRAPTFNDLFFPGYGVPTIKPERGRSFEVGAAWQADGTSAAVTIYRNKVRDLIGYQPDRTFCPADPAYDFGCADNTSRAKLQGATLSGAQRWGALNVRGTLDFLDARDTDTGVHLARRAAHQETIAVDYGTGAWTVGGSVVDVGSRPDAGVVLGGYAVVDLKSMWRIVPQWRIEARLLNALDHRVEPVRDYQGLGRQAWIGVRYDGRGF